MPYGLDNPAEGTEEWREELQKRKESILRESPSIGGAEANWLALKSLGYQTTGWED